MSVGKPKKYKEPPEAKLLRARQIEDIAELDEEQNRRIKGMLRARLGGRAFRAPTAARSAANTAGSLVSATGFNAPASMGGGRGAVSAPVVRR